MPAKTGYKKAMYSVVGGVFWRGRWGHG